MNIDEFQNKFDIIIEDGDHILSNQIKFITPTEKKNETRLFFFIYLKTMF